MAGDMEGQDLARRSEDGRRDFWTLKRIGCSTLGAMNEVRRGGMFEPAVMSVACRPKLAMSA